MRGRTDMTWVQWGAMLSVGLVALVGMVVANLFLYEGILVP